MYSFWFKADWGWSLLSLWKGLSSVSYHLNWEMQMTFYLELFRQCLIKWSALMTPQKAAPWTGFIPSLLEYYDIVDQIFAVCWDTTSSYTCVFSGAIVLLCTKSWTLPSCGFSAGGTCWQNTSLTSLGHSLERRPRPPEGAVCQTSEGLANNQEWDWQNRRAGVTRNSPSRITLVRTCQWSSAFGRRALTLEYKKLCELFVGSRCSRFSVSSAWPLPWSKLL